MDLQGSPFFCFFSLFLFEFCSLRGRWVRFAASPRHSSPSLGVWDSRFSPSEGGHVLDSCHCAVEGQWGVECGGLGPPVCS